jgi:hypothetical protein
MSDIQAFKKDLEGLINHHSLENLSNTPDFILADYIVNCLLAYNIAVNCRDKWSSKIFSENIQKMLEGIPDNNLPETTTGDE